MLPWLKHMLPLAAMHDVADRALCNAELFADRSLGLALRYLQSNSAHLVFSEPVIVVLFAWMCPTATAFILPVLYIVMRGTQPEVCWVNASRIVTGVTDLHTLWNRALVQCVGYAMRAGFVQSVAAAPAVAISVYRAFPQPAGCSLVDDYVRHKAVEDTMQLVAGHSNLLSPA